MERDPKFKKNLKRFMGEPSAPTMNKSSHHGGPATKANKLDSFIGTY
jgi:hypothetical protein